MHFSKYKCASYAFKYYSGTWCQICELSLVDQCMSKSHNSTISQHKLSHTLDYHICYGLYRCPHDSLLCPDMCCYSEHLLVTYKPRCHMTSTLYKTFFVSISSSQKIITLSITVQKWSDLANVSSTLVGMHCTLVGPRIQIVESGFHSQIVKYHWPIPRYLASSLW